MKLQRKVHVLGGAHSTFIGKHHPDFIWKRHPDFGKRNNPTIEEHLFTAVRGALSDTGVEGAQVERGFVGNFTGECFVNQGHMGAMMAGADPGLAGKPMARVEGACASGGLAVGWAVDAIQAGWDVVLVAGAEVQTTVSARQGADFGKDHPDLAPVVVKAYDNANHNPHAHMRARVPAPGWAEVASDSNPTFLSNEELAPFLKFSDCSQVSDGASAIVLVSDAGLAKLGKSAGDAVQILSCGQAANPLGDPADLTRLETTEAAAARAYADAGLTAADMQVAEVHDCFSVTELLMTEALGFADRGQGAPLAASGATLRDGSIPVNTGGGLIAFGHPVGATGVKQVLEIARQMHGLCGDYQMPTPPTKGVAANLGGDDRTAVVTVIGA